MDYKNTSGNNFSYSSIKGILINPKYKGFYCGSKTHKIDFRHSDVKRLSEDEWIIYLEERYNLKFQERVEYVCYNPENGITKNKDI